MTRLGARSVNAPGESRLEKGGAESSLWSGQHGLLEVTHGAEELHGDVVLAEPSVGRVERLIRSGSDHNTLLVTEQCDQLCTMCSQPPKKSHTDRFDFFIEACLLADPNITIGISGGEPTLHMDRLLDMIETVTTKRPDLNFHILSNAQHFERYHVERLRQKLYRSVVWGIPLYSSDPATHDAIVGKPGAYERLLESFCHLFAGAARIELRTVLLSTNAPGLDRLAHFVTMNLPQIEQWSIMDLENAGFARTRFAELRFPLSEQFEEIASAFDRAILHGVPVKLFNAPLCHVPENYRHLAVASISDWKQRFAEACNACSVKNSCSGFFEWHPDELVEEVVPL
ncbi:His-Xaa-Ser system radical SAM maturase HxsC [Erythrobacter sp. THAF29]|uniref:His-Xaa-Ser system radical SAM maturase HxsC n=1 Tax=Erythrobacter sp. THAF29 TaxID=2587851 RepID=UPI002106E102|nr:His-Xaa-Ser system radical SAM maturase HxsC [Erythrobacter sp. THAF29]